MTEHETIAKRIREHAAFLQTVRVSQDGWAKVVRRMAEDAIDTAEALDCQKIVAHVPKHLKGFV